MKPTLFLHIGRPKTGSTALQQFLMKNAAKLLKQGICYPETGRYQMASHLFAFAYLPELQTGSRAPEVSSQDIWQSLQEEVRSLSPRSLVLSSENFWFLNPAELPSDLGENFDVQVIAYLRRQDNVLASSFCEEVKGGKLDVKSDISAYATRHERLQLLDYHRVLSPWGKRFGDDHVSIRVYEGIPDGGIAADFCQVLRVAAEDFIVPAAPVNPSLPYDVLRLLSNLNDMPLGQLPRRQFVSALSQASSLLAWDPRYDTAGLFNQELRQKLLAHFSESNRQVLERFQCSVVGDLFPEPDFEACQEPSSGLDIERITGILAALSVIQERKIHRMTSRLKRVEDELTRLSRAGLPVTGGDNPPAE